MGNSSSSFTLGRVLIFALILVLGGAVAKGFISNFEQTAEKGDFASTVSVMLTGANTVAELDSFYADADGDLLADAPEREELLAKPTELTFSFIASSDQDEQAKIWEPIAQAIGEKTGLPIKYLPFEDGKSQLEALRNGQLHIVGLSSGAVPVGVNKCGFIPICTFGREDDSFGYTMKFIANAKTGIKSVDKIGDHKVAFTRPRSNSGYKASIVLLKEKKDLLPERDYAWYYTYDHEVSIHDVISGKADAAPIASDILARVSEEDGFESDAITEIYESERFPPAAFGFAYNLSPSIQEAIKEAFISFDWAGTPLEEEFGPAGNVKFVSVTYKDDWANIRRVDRALQAIHANVNSGTSHN